MNRNQIVTEKSELFDAICYIKGCSNIAVTSARLGVNEKLDFVIPVCEFCLPKISKEIPSSAHDKSKFFDGSEK